MEATTANSGATVTVTLRPAKIPVPDAAFFHGFAPELLYAGLSGLFVAVMAYVFSSLLTRTPDVLPEASNDAVTPLSSRDRALAELAAANVASADFAERVWSAVREFLSREFSDAAFLRRTATEAVREFRRRRPEGSAGFSEIASAALRLEYGPTGDAGSDELLQANLRLRESAERFLTSDAWENSSR